MGFYIPQWLLRRSRRLRDIGPHLRPGSDTPLQERYTGIGPVDYWLTVLEAVFANIFDGSAPKLSIYAFHFAGQLIPVITVMCIESCREGNEETVMSLSLISQATASLHIVSTPQLFDSAPADHSVQILPMGECYAKHRLRYHNAHILWGSSLYVSDSLERTISNPEVGTATG